MFLKALNYDMINGKLLEMPGIKLGDDEFIEMFIEAANEQNDSDILEDATKLDLLMDYKKGEFEWFYNPFGVEIAYRVPYNYGFYSCTMDPETIFKK